jgi:hypothetical protein
MAWVTPEDVLSAWIGEGAPTDTEQVDVWIGKAERMIRREVPDLQARIDAEADQDPAVTELLETAKDVTIAAVTRVFRNPEGRRQTATTSGPYTDSVTYGGDNPGGLTLLDEERAWLRGDTGGQSAFSIDLAPSEQPTLPLNAWELNV